MKMIQIKMLSISKLFPQDCLKGKLASIGNLEQLEGSRTGSTTGNALVVIGEAMRNIGVSVSFKEGETDKHTVHLRNVIASLISELKLNHFDLQLNTLTYNIYNSVLVTENNKIYLEIE